MGRTNPTYRDAVEQVEDDWQPLRRALRHKYTADFDRLFDHARMYADAGGYLNTYDPAQVVLFSVLLAHEHQLQQLREQAGEGDDATADL